MPANGIAALLAIALLAGVAAAAPEVIWIEGEAPASANFEFTAVSWGPVMSGGEWLHFSRGADQAEAALGQDGLLLQYDVQAPKAGAYEVWARLGFEWVRAPLEWRVNDGEWQRFGHDDLTTNLLEIGVWAEVAWGRFGTAQLAEGANTLEVRYTEPNPGGRLIVALDCFAFVEGEGAFTPEGVLRPGQTYGEQVDRDAAAHVYRFGLVGEGAGRVELPLDGPWQVARYDDPDMDARTYEPLDRLPADDEYELRWMGISVPGNARSRPELKMGHRLLYRTRVDVPAELDGRGFHLHFSGTNWIAGVFVNGVYCGGRKSVLVPWDMDVTKAVRPGEINTVTVSIKSSWYGIEPGEGETVDHMRNRPYEGEFKRNYRFVGPFFPSTKGEGDGMAVGIINPVKLVATGPAYTSDIYVRPGFAQKNLRADVTVASPADEGADLSVLCEAVNQDGDVEATFGPVQVNMPTGESATVAVAGDWADPKLWWPEPDPALYVMRTSVMRGDETLDIHEETFGFREITTEGKEFRINGIPWHFWNWVDVGRASSEQEWLTNYRAHNDRFHRISADHDRLWGYRERALEFFDRNGIPGRLSTCVDGMFITHNLANPLVWENFQEHTRQVVEAYRNHPSVMMWSLGNEMIFITSRLASNAQDNLRWMAEAQKLSDLAKQLDPTRPSFQDGGGDLNKAGEANCQHYSWPQGSSVPTECYSYRLVDGPWTPTNVWDRSMAQYGWDGKRPLVQGEVFFYSGNPSAMAWVGGPDVYRGKEQATVAAARYARIGVEGARWQGVTGICPWVILPEAAVSFEPRAAFVREYNNCFFPNAQVQRTIKVFNDGHSEEPLTLKWRLVLDGKEEASGEKTYEVPPGRALEDTLTVRMPTAGERIDGELQLELLAAGEQVFADAKPVSVLPTSAPMGAIGAGALCVYDPEGKLVDGLDALMIEHTAIDSLSAIPETADVLLVGANALPADGKAEAAAGIRAFVESGKTAVVLEQRHPLEGDDLPVPGISLAGRQADRPARPEFAAAGGQSGRISFPVALAHPAMEGLTERDFFTWAGDEMTFRLSYAAPSSGAIALVQAGRELRLAPMLDIPVGKGRYVLSQMLIGEKLGREPVAGRLLRNLLVWAVQRAGAEPGHTVAHLAGDAELGALLEDVAVAHDVVPGLDEALADDVDVAIVRATPQVLAQLADRRQAVRAFCERGSWLMLVGVDAEGLASFSELVGVRHRLRPFRREAVVLDARFDPLLLGLSDRDVSMISDEVLAPWANLMWVSDLTFSSVVDAGADAASFAQFGSDYLAKVANGLTNDDFWQYICYFGGTEREPVLEMPFDGAETFTGIDLWSNESYRWVKDIEVVFDDDAGGALPFTLKPEKGRQELAFEPRRASKVAIRILSSHPSDNPQELVGIDQLKLYRQLPQDWDARVVQLTNPGGLVKYPIGDGGIVLNQIDYASEHPTDAGREKRNARENAAKKRAIYANLLRNMGAAFGG